jgi:hypothetical protein
VLYTVEIAFFYIYPTKNPLSLESDKGFGLYIVSTGLRLREDSFCTGINKTVISDKVFSYQ